jgi:methylenetetrahydrofolate reductase (NADPH)
MYIVGDAKLIDGSGPTHMTQSHQALPSLSFEFFPPHTPEGAQRLWRSVERLAPLAPTFVSVTYGAGGTTRERTRNAIQAIRERARLNVAGHLTCVGATREETLEVARSYARLGVRRIVALRGDPPKGEGGFVPHPDGFASSVELIEGLRGIGGFEIAVGAYPEKHPEARTLQDDVDHLKRKVDAGASLAITQFFFENDVFLRFRDACTAAGIAVPVVPGILPIENFHKMTNFAARCQARVPDWMHAAYAEAVEVDAARALSVELALKQLRALVAEGVEHLHIYTLNNPDLSFDICEALGYRAQPAAVAQGGAA